MQLRKSATLVQLALYPLGLLIFLIMKSTYNRTCVFEQHMKREHPEKMYEMVAKCIYPREHEQLNEASFCLVY